MRYRQVSREWFLVYPRKFMTVKLIKGIKITAFIKTGVGDFEGHKFSSKLKHFSFVS